MGGCMLTTIKINHKWMEQAFFFIPSSALVVNFRVNYIGTYMKMKHQFFL